MEIFCFWLLSLRIIFLRFHLCHSLIYLELFSCYRVTFQCIPIHHQLMGIWIALVLGSCVFVWTCIYFIYLGGLLRSEFAGFFEKYIVTFLRNYRLFAKETVPFYIPTRSVGMCELIVILMIVYLLESSHPNGGV